jgi:fructokinase
MRIGIDLGGSKIEGIILGPNGSGGSGGDEVCRHRTDTPQGNYDATLAAVADLVARLAGDAGASDDTPVGVGIPGTISPASGLVKNANSTCLIGHPLDRDLAAALNRPVKLANDADCFTISEATDGAGQGANIVFGVIIGTGCGGGITVDGKPLAGPNAITGEWGHNPIPWPQTIDGIDERPGPECYCGRKGCIETFLSGPGLEREFESATGQHRTAREIAIQTDSDSEAVLHRYEHRLARALASIINVLDPNVIVLGGGLSNISRLYDTVPKIWGQWVFSDTVSTELKPARHGDSSGVRGAAWLW